MKSIAVNEAIENISEYLGSDNIYPYFVSVSGSKLNYISIHHRNKVTDYHDREGNRCCRQFQYCNTSN